MRPSHVPFRPVALVVLMFFFHGSLMAQDPLPRAAREQRIENLQLRERERYLEKMPKEGAVIAKADKYLLSFGGWADVDYIDFGNDDNNREEKDVFDADLMVDTRLWVKGVWRMDLGKREYEHTVFAQFRNLYTERWPSEGQPLVQDDNDGPHVDLLYGDLDLGLGKLRTGRQYLNLGQGIVLSDVYDGFKFSGSVSDVSFETFVAKTLPHAENIDYSVPGYDKTSKRYFTGGDVVWRPKMEFGLYGFFLIQHDESQPSPATNQDYNYDSQHWGVGSTYEFEKGPSLWGEYIFETGSSAVFGEEKRSDVLAHAFDLGASYEYPWFAHPEISLEYAFGSGDGDRTSVTNTEGGNLRGRDHNFLPFGFFPAGYALEPVLSNIHILRTGVAVKPLEKYWALRKLQLRTDGYFYWKAKAKGGIYDIDATEPSSDIGREIDFTLLWPVFSDVEISVRYGLFFPGKAFPAQSNDPESYLSTSLSVTF
ncbi:MAG: alginate export family protein [Candidatus Omnitrophota bacterium]